jgi:uncharacterized protein (DUF2236 family)
MESTDRDHPFYFSPKSMVWRVNREQVVLLGGTRAVLLQIAHPLVAEGVYDHSIMFTRLVERLLRTLRLTLTPIFGTRDEVAEAARAINQAHHPVRGRLSEAVGPYAKGTPYDAHYPELATWVFATLADTSVVCYERFVAPLDPDEKETYYTESKQTMAYIGVTPEILPASYADLRCYMDEMIASSRVMVGPRAREIAAVVLLQSNLFLRILTYPTYHLTIGLLPPVLRQQFGFGLAPWEEKAIDGFCRATRRLVPFLPDRIRYVAQYRRARTLAGL